MVNVAGYKVWPREVEDVFYPHPQVKDATVVCVADEYRGEAVKAFVALKGEDSVSENELISYCKERIAYYKYPEK